MIDLWPAIDLINSTSVRLTEGKYDSKEKMEKSVEDSIRFYSQFKCCLLYTSPSPRDATLSRMPSSA